MNPDNRATTSRSVAGSAGLLLRTIPALVSANAGILLLLAAWQAWVFFGGVSQIVMPSPASVARDLADHPEAYLPHLATTVGAALAGLVMGQLLGIVLATAAHLSGVVRTAVRPTVLIVRSVPMVAMVPVFARMVGYGMPTVLMVATLVAYFPAFVLTSQGLSGATQAERDLMTALGASRFDRFWRLDLPSAVPSILASLRLSSVSCVVGVLLAEFVVGNSGLGQLFVLSRVSYDMSRSWGAVVVATTLSLTLFGLFSWLARSATRLHSGVGG